MSNRLWLFIFLNKLLCPRHFFKMAGHIVVKKVYSVTATFVHENLSSILVERKGKSHLKSENLLSGRVSEGNVWEGRV